MKLGTRGQYAVMAMADLAARATHQPVCLADIAARQLLPLSYLEQLFVKLRQRGLVRSIRGHQGGYVLTTAPEHTNIFQIIQAVEEEIQTTRCRLSAESSCLGKKTEKCLTHDLWAGLEAHISHYLSSVTLKDVCTGQHLLTVSCVGNDQRVAS